MDNTKRVQFAADSKDSSRPYTPLLKSVKQRRAPEWGEVILKNWTRNSVEHLENSEGGADKLSAILDGFELNSQKIVEFMEKHGNHLLIFAMVFRRSSEHLRFICNYVPQELLKKILMQSNYYALGSLLSGNSSLEEKGRFDTKAQQEQATKVKLLLQVDLEGLEAYMQSEAFKNRYGLEVQACCKQTVVDYKTTLLPNQFKAMGANNSNHALMLGMGSRPDYLISSP